MKYLLEDTRGGWRCLRSMSMSANRRDGVPVVRIQNEVGIEQPPDVVREIPPHFKYGRF